MARRLSPTPIVKRMGCGTLDSLSALDGALSPPRGGASAKTAPHVGNGMVALKADLNPQKHFRTAGDIGAEGISGGGHGRT